MTDTLIITSTSNIQVNTNDHEHYLNVHPKIKNIEFHDTIKGFFNLPNHIEKLTIKYRDNFDLPTLPTNLKELCIISEYFDSPIDNVLPAGLEKLSIKTLWNTQDLSCLENLHSLNTLSLKLCQFNRSKNIICPKNVKHLHLEGYGVKDMILPTNLETLGFGHNWNVPMNVLPDTLTSLKLIGIFETINCFPCNIKELYVHGCCESIRNLPSTLKKLTLKYSLINSIDIPDNVEEIYTYEENVRLLKIHTRPYIEYQPHVYMNDYMERD
jgi:hypothetical protein